MKKIIVISIFFFYPFFVCFTEDRVSVEIFSKFQNAELNAVSELLNIGSNSYRFNDSILYGKRLMLYIKEYLNGELVRDEPIVKCGSQIIKSIENNDTMLIELPDLCLYFDYPNDTTGFNINFYSRIINKDSVTILCKLSTGFSIHFNLQNSKDFSITPLFNNRIPINDKIPMLALSSGYKVNNHITNYCILNTKPIEKWFSFFRMKHYIVIYIWIS